MRRTALLAVTVLLEAVGCRRFTPVPLSPETTAQALLERSLDDAALHVLFERAGQPWPGTRWGLDALTLAAFRHQPTLAVARAQRRVAEAGVSTAGARPNPIVSITPQYVANSPRGVVPWDITSALDWPIETAGKRGRRIDQAQHLETAARLALDAAAWTVRQDVHARLIDCVAADTHVALLQRERGLRHQLVELFEHRLRAGAVSIADVAPLQAAERQTLIDLADAERRQGEARVSLAEAVGVPASALDGIVLESPIGRPTPSLERPDAELQRAALERRPDVLASLAEYAASQSALQLEIARQYPDIRIGPGYEYDQGLNKWATVGVSIELPVLNRNQGPIGEAAARRAEAAARFTALQASVLAALERGLTNVAQARRAIAEADRLCAGASERRRATDAAFKLGAVDLPTLRYAELTTLSSERIRFDARIALERARGDLESAVQPPLPGWSAALEGEAP